MRIQSIVQEKGAENFQQIPAKRIAEINAEIAVEMKKFNREFQKKQKKSLEKASKIVLNS